MQSILFESSCSFRNSNGIHGKAGVAPPGGRNACGKTNCKSVRLKPERYRHDDMKKAMLLPFSSLLEIFPILVRDISHEQGKEVYLVICGETGEGQDNISNGGGQSH